MKVLRVFTGLLTLMIYLPFSVYGSYLLYKHINASEIMWFIWWITIPVMIISSTITVVVDRLTTKGRK